MYPKHYIDYFRKFNREEDVFITMPFSDNFELRYKKIYEPVIRKIGLNPNKVNNKYIRNSILIDILQGISDSKLIMVDVTMDENGYINSNVMYELGLAQATRMPEEVVVVTSCDIEKLPFDTPHIRSNKLEVENIYLARNKLEKIFRSCIQSIRKVKDKMLEATMSSLDLDSSYFIAMEMKKSHIEYYRATGGAYGYLSWQETRNLIKRLVEIQVLEIEKEMPEGKPAYKWSCLGRTLISKYRDYFEVYRS